MGNVKVSIDPSADVEAFDDIVAVATAPGRGALAIVRISGKRLRAKLASIVRPVQKKSQYNHSVMVYSHLLREPDGEILDDVMVVFYDEPHSFSGEDSCEIFTHGGSFITNSAIQAIVSLGFRMALPGEFTRRAYLRGKLDLTKAEGILSLTEAQCEQQWLAARCLASGTLQKNIESLRVALVQALAYLEARIDFPDEEETSHIPLSTVVALVDHVDAELTSLIDNFRSGRVARSGLRVALIGEPNVGKSSLMNLLLESQRSIVTNIPGTTRDYIEESCVINGRLITIVDTAGIRQTSQEIERLGIERTLEQAAEADLVIAITQVGQKFDLSNHIEHERVLKVVNKCDLESNASVEDGGILISCKTGSGITELKSIITKIVDEHIETISGKRQGYISTPRHLASCKSAKDAIARFYQAIDNITYDECLAFEVRLAASALSEILGHISGDDILDVIFGDFCIGK